MIPDETLQLLRAIYRGQREGYLTLTAIHPTKKQSTPSRHLHIRDKAGIHQTLSDLLRANEQGWGAYFSIALRREPLGRWKRGGQADLLSLTALYADLDGDLSASFARIRQAGLRGLPPPSALVGSGRGLHLYWCIQASADFLLADRILTGLAQTLGGDTVHPAQALRLPGSYNTKSAVQRPCQLLWLVEDRRYTLADFAAFVPTSPESPPQPRAPPPHLDQINPDLIDAVTRTLLRDWGGFVQKNGWIGALCPCGHRHDTPGKHFAYMEYGDVSRSNKQIRPAQPRLNINLPRSAYDYLAYGAKMGTRNNTLFAAACQFRDAGFNLAQAELLLIPRFLADGQYHESAGSLESEARRSIRSAYSRYPRAQPIKRAD